MRGTKVKKLRKLYRAVIEQVKDHVPEGMGVISFRTFKKRATR